MDLPHWLSPAATVAAVRAFVKRAVFGATTEAELRRFLDSIAPEQPAAMLRLGRDFDGGYLVPDDLAGIRYCFSPGVDNVASFEADLLERAGIRSFLADFSVDAPPAGVEIAGFVKKFIGPPGRGERYITLEDWVNGSASPDGDLLLQMDIEGGEYDVLLSAPPRLLRRFRIMVIEFHDLRSMRDGFFFRRLRRVFSRIMRDFRVAHIHPNNAGIVEYLGSVPLPDVVEMTFVRRDRRYELAASPAFPHPLDRPNIEGREEIPLPPAWRPRH